MKKLSEHFSRTSTFWRDPYSQASKSAGSKDARFLDQNLRDKQYGRSGEQVMDRLYVLRGQVVHGAATANSKLNRRTIEQCLELLSAVVPALIHLAIEHGCNDDEWPELCYPPMR